VDYRLEVVRLPVSDVDRAKDFYQRLGWRLDGDFALGEGIRVVQVTPPGSACSVSFGIGINEAAPGSAQVTELVVDDIDAARAELAGRGGEVSEAFHRDGAKQIPGPDPERRSYLSYATFNDPDGNGWLLQEVTTRLPGRTTSVLAAYGSVAALADALRRAKAAHGRHEAETGRPDPDWPAWYAQYIADESAGQDTGA
jgi:catechol 2,3-dioxygenase-like lactoylglutathione lyase family enzyme